MGLADSFIETYIPDSPFFTLEENQRRAYLMEKYLSNLSAIEDGNGCCMENLETISLELDEIFYGALNRRRGDCRAVLL
jgi:hypothetical protein